jgi:hypothetical protein
MLAGCQQTVHLYDTTPPHDAGRDVAVAATGGKSGAGGSGGTDAGSADARCFGGTTPIAFTPDKPRMVVLLDRSTSMGQGFGAYSQLTTAMNELSAQVYDFTNPNHHDHPSIQFSFVAFPETDGSSCQPQMGCCASSVQNDWGSFSKNVTSCSSSTSGCSNSANRPISAALHNAQVALDGGPPTTNNSPRYVVLITDGSPAGGCAPPGSNDCNEAQIAAQALANEDVKLAVVGIGNASTVGACLASLTSGGRFYLAGTDTDLYNDLQDIMSSAVCAVTVTGPLPASSSLQVSVGFMSYPQNSPDGWSYDYNTGRLHLYGSMCSAYAQYGGLSISAGCGRSGP